MPGDPEHTPPPLRLQLCSSLPALGQFFLPIPHPSPQKPSVLCCHCMFPNKTYFQIPVHSFTHMFMPSAEAAVVEEGQGASLALPLCSSPGLGLPMCSRRRWVRPACFKLSLRTLVSKVLWTISDRPNVHIR